MKKLHSSSGLYGCLSIAVFVSASGAEESKCNQVSKIDCDNNYTPEGDERVCCSDNKVYLNL